MVATSGRRPASVLARLSRTSVGVGVVLILAATFLALVWLDNQRGHVSNERPSFADIMRNSKLWGNHEKPKPKQRDKQICSEDGPTMRALRKRAVEAVAKGKMVVLVTGAAGFIGMHSSIRLQKEGHVVIGMDNYNAYYDVRLKRRRADLVRESGAHIFDADVCDVTAVACLFDAIPFTHILHLAAQAGVRHALDDPLSYVRSNIECWVVLLEGARAENERRRIGAEGAPVKVVYASSSSVYGLNEKTPFSETDVTDSQASLYGATKKSGEAIAHAYNHIFKIPLTGLRFFTVYGPWGRPDMAAFSFTRKIVNGETLTVFRRNDGAELVRDFTYVDDVVSGIMGALEHIQEGNHIYNLGNNKPEKVSTLIKEIEASVGRSASISYRPIFGGDVPVTYADVSAAERDLGYRASTPLRVGIRSFLAWYSQFYGVSMPALAPDSGTAPHDGATSRVQGGEIVASSAPMDESRTS